MLKYYINCFGFKVVIYFNKIMSGICFENYQIKEMCVDIDNIVCMIRFN